jgi:hypothetical protein
MIRKLLLVSLGCLYAVSALGGACQGQACRDTFFDKDANGCLEIRNAAREDIEVTVYTAATIPITVRIASGDTEKVYKTGRMCLPATEYMRSTAKFAGGTFSPSR